MCAVATNRRVQLWSAIHEGVLAEVAPHPAEVAAMGPTAFGVLHGDLNSSNAYFDVKTGMLSVYDWDQVQRGWWEWDLAQIQFGIEMLEEAGLPVAGVPVPQASNPAQFQHWLVVGYETVAGAGAVDYHRLRRMVELKRTFYERFCRRAIAEGSIPQDMAPFIEYIVAWFDRRAASTTFAASKIDSS